VNDVVAVQPHVLWNFYALAAGRSNLWATSKPPNGAWVVARPAAGVRDAMTKPGASFNNSENLNIWGIRLRHCRRLRNAKMAIRG
jgi:hypothetical protein